MWSDEDIANDGVAQGVQKIITVGLVPCGAALLAFHLLLFLRDNSAPMADLADFRRGPDNGFIYHVEQCRSNGKQIAVHGWLVRKGRGAGRRTIRVIALDSAGRPHAIKTSLRQRDDVDDLIAKRLGDGIAYRNTGFVASINLAVAGERLDGEHLYLAYDDGDEQVLLPISCRAGQAP